MMINNVLIILIFALKFYLILKLLNKFIMILDMIVRKGVDTCVYISEDSYLDIDVFVKYKSIFYGIYFIYIYNNRYHYYLTFNKVLVYIKNILIVYKSFGCSEMKSIF